MNCEIKGIKMQNEKNKKQMKMHVAETNEIHFNSNKMVFNISWLNRWTSFFALLFTTVCTFAVHSVFLSVGV